MHVTLAFQFLFFGLMFDMLANRQRY